MVEVLAERLKDVAAGLLEANPDDLELVDGTVRVKGTPTASIELPALARSAYSSGEALEAAYDFAVPEGGWSQATHLCQVEVDADTGLVRIVRYLVVGDCGALINPAVVEGQVRGGIAQGIGGVLHEWAAYDDEGQPQATTLLDYLAPGALDLPTIEVEHLQSPPQGPLDFRGVGEGGAIGAPAALVSAIADAIGVPITERYLPPARILELMGTI